MMPNNTPLSTDKVETDILKRLVESRGDKPKCAVVAMSGGVDSSLTAGLYQRAGYRVIGITMQLHSSSQTASPSDQCQISKQKTCCSGRDIADARACADALGIDHYVVDLQKEFQNHVVDDFVESYARGETPIPCIRCNQHLKFDHLLTMAKDLGADVLATGHYVRRVVGKEGLELHTGIDAVKDQSYFLFATTAEQLSICDFPLGGLRKEETRALAAKWKLSVAQKTESQDICFIPDGDYGRLLRRLKPEVHRPGLIMDQEGREVGKHNGIAYYTIGQRRGLGIGGRTNTSIPLYVLRLDPKENIVYVGPKEALQMQQFALSAVQWINRPPDPKQEITVKVRARMPKVVAKVLPPHGEEKRWAVEVPSGTHSVAPGQACVIYSGSQVLGGGWIAPFRGQTVARDRRSFAEPNHQPATL